MTSLMGTLMLTSLAIGCIGRADTQQAVCDTTGVQAVEVSSWIQCMESAPCWRDRERAATTLRRYDWRCHPEAAIALMTAMLLDDDDDVREAAAKSIAKMRPCLPEVHIGLTRAAQTDPDFWTRFWARRGLRAIGNSCQGPCSACGTMAMVPVIIAPAVQPLPVPSDQIAPPPDGELVPPSERPATPPGTIRTSSRPTPERPAPTGLLRGLLLGQRARSAVAR